MKACTIGVCIIELYMPSNHSLKDKRRILRSIKAKIKNKFNVSIAEIGEQEKWQKAVLGIAALSNDKGFVNEVLDKVVDLIVKGYAEVEIIRHQLEFI